MHSLNIIVGNVVWSMLYHDQNGAEKAEKELGSAVGQGAPVQINDDFGQRAVLIPTALKGWLLEDLEQSKLAHCERMLHQARTQGQAQRMAESDPSLRQASQMRGPSVLSAVPGGRN